jgi:hypothetical protein
VPWLPSLVHLSSLRAARANGHTQLVGRFAVLLADCEGLCDTGTRGWQRGERAADSQDGCVPPPEAPARSALEARVRLAAAGFDFGALLGEGPAEREEIPKSGAVHEETHAGPRPGPSPTRLRITIGGRRSGRILTGSSLLIGRRDPSNGALPDLDLWPDTAVSRRLGKVHWDGAYYLSDLGSTNGTTLNGEKVREGSSVGLRVGDVASLGERRCWSSSERRSAPCVRTGAIENYFEHRGRKPRS